MRRIVVGTAGWGIPRSAGELFGTNGSSLERYASVFQGVEVNSTFYRVHKDATLTRWSAAVPSVFRFAFKVPKAITHTGHLASDDIRLGAFMKQIALAGERLGPVLVQLPPSLVFEPESVERFLQRLRSTISSDIAFEPRHRSWLEAGALFKKYNVARVAADPPLLDDAFKALVTEQFGYLRLHGKPKVYYSSYSDDFIVQLADALLASKAALIWCIFDNTGSGVAMHNALALKKTLVERIKSPIAI